MSLVLACKLIWYNPFNLHEFDLYIKTNTDPEHSQSDLTETTISVMHSLPLVLCIHFGNGDCIEKCKWIQPWSWEIFCPNSEGLKKTVHLRAESQHSEISWQLQNGKSYLTVFHMEEKMRRKNYPFRKRYWTWRNLCYLLLDKIESHLFKLFKSTFCSLCHWEKIVHWPPTNQWTAVLQSYSLLV